MNENVLLSSMASVWRASKTREKSDFKLKEAGDNLHQVPRQGMETGSLHLPHAHPPSTITLATTLVQLLDSP